MNALKPATVLMFGSVNVDLVAEVERIPRGGETILAERGSKHFGGKGANQAVACARGRRDPRTSVLMAGAIGDDALGLECIANLLANGVETSLLRRSTLPTGFAFIAVDSRGENAITVVPGANLDAAAGQVGDEKLKACSIVAAQLEIPVAEAIHLFRRARAAGVRGLLNLAPLPASDSVELFAALLEAVDIAVFNQHELAATAQRLSLTSSDSHEVRASVLARQFAMDVLVTLGADGVLLADAQGTINALPGLPVKVVDTTGAGDTFVGVLAVTLAEGATLLAAAERANRAAALACRAMGAQSGMPRAMEIDG